MKITTMKRILSLILCVIMLSSLFACNETPSETSEQTDEITTEETTTDQGNISTETDGPDLSGSDSGTAETSEPESNAPESSEPESSAPETNESESSTPETSEPETSKPETYGNGDEIMDAGTAFEEDAFALSDHPIDASTALEMSAAELLALLTDKNNETDKSAEKVFKVTEPLVLEANTKYYGNFSAVIAEGGVIIKDAEEIVVKELILKGNITVENSVGITFFKLDVTADKTAVTIDEKSSDIAFKNCKMTASATAMSSQGATVSVYSNVITAPEGIISSGDELAVQNTVINSSDKAIDSTGAYCTVKNNEIDLSDKSFAGVVIGKGSENALVALNIIKNAQCSISVSEAYNAVVLLNSAVSVIGKNCTNLYVVENKLGGLIMLYGNDYLLCDGNAFAQDGKDHTVEQTENANFNGDNLHDVNARVEHGANEDILPHTNKDLFLDMKKQSKVRDISQVKSYAYSTYIRTMAKQSDKVIIPPGVYTINSTLKLDAAHSNTTVYAYGVYQEKTVAKTATGHLPEGEKRVINNLGLIYSANGSNISVKGLTFGYDYQSSGQAYVIEKFRDADYGNAIRIVSSAGYIDDFGPSNTDMFTAQILICSGDEMYPWLANFGWSACRRDPDGTIVIKCSSNAQYEKVNVGDVLGCRFSGDNTSSISLAGTNALLKDCVLYGYSRALAITSSGRTAKGVMLERFHNTTHSAPIISEETYNYYKSLEKKYNLTSDGDDPTADGAFGLEVYIDDQGRYRGGLPRFGSVDATHISGAAEGTSATSCIFENMVDDGSNQRYSSARIAGAVDNGDGTTTIYHKGGLTSVYFGIDLDAGRTTGTPTGAGISFLANEKIFAYASNGHTLVEASVITGSEFASILPASSHMFHADEDRDCICDESTCKAALHYDHKNNDTGATKPDHKCDVCGMDIHTDFREDYGYSGVAIPGENDPNTYYTGDNRCNVCGATLKPFLDENGNVKLDANSNTVNEADNKVIVVSMTSPATYTPSTSTLSYSVYSFDDKKYITYSSRLQKVTVKTEDVDFDALEGYDLTDNDYFMEHKIMCDNISLNSTGFTFDNVLMQNYHSRGILMKTRDATVKNCTFRNVALTGMLLSIETVWGESTVAKNITIKDCLFDHTGFSYNTSASRTICPISIQGLGDLSGNLKNISENTLPCKNIKIIGNKFKNTDNEFMISISAAQDVTIKDNVFEGRERSTKYEVIKAIYIDGCMNIDISGNTFFFDGINDTDTRKFIVGWNYKGLSGSDVQDVLPEERGDYPG